MGIQVRWWPVLLLPLFGAGSAQRCVPLVTCPALLRDPASHLVGSKAACYLQDRSRGVRCPSEAGSSRGRQGSAGGHSGYSYSSPNGHQDSSNNGYKYGSNKGYRYRSQSVSGRSAFGGFNAVAHNYHHNYGSSRSFYDSSGNGFSRLQQYLGFGSVPPPTARQRRARVPLPRRLTEPEEIIVRKLSPELASQVEQETERELRSGEHVAAVLSAQGSNLALVNTPEDLQLSFSRPVYGTTFALGRQGERHSIMLNIMRKAGVVFSGRSRQPQLASHQHYSLPDPPADLQAAREPTPGCVPARTPFCGGKTIRYRTVDGTCNNRQRPREGSAHTAFARFFPSDYDDGVHAPRSLGIGGRELPSPRLVSSRVGESNSRDSWDVFRTIGLTMFGQFVDHDLTSTPEFALENTSTDEAGEGGGFKCCNRDHSFPATSLHPLACIPFRVPADDPVFGPQGVTCMNQVRSLLVEEGDCLPRPAAQQNQITHFLDGSNIYGSSQEDSDKLRLHFGGLMRSSQPGSQLPRDQSRCTNHPDDCLISGDHRTSENLGLAMEHLVWMREHNRVARELAVLHPEYNDDTLYHEARRIVVGQYQHVVYNEWLPAVLGYGYTEETGLTPGMSTGYDPDARAIVTNEFATAAFRFAHSMIHDVFEMESRAIELERTFFNSSLLMKFGLVRELARSLTSQRPGWVDRVFTDAIRERLFIMPGMPGMDLIALNINRGREHGIQPYITAVENCHGRTVNSWSDLGDLMASEAIDRLRSVYDSPEDVDMFIGLVSERRATYSAVGKTLQCLIGQTFVDLRNGDRFFYEHSGLPNSFTSTQLTELRKASQARVYCDNIPGMGHIQPLAFFQPQFFSNARQDCNSMAIPRPDLSVF